MLYSGKRIEKGELNKEVKPGCSVLIVMSDVMSLK